jgi:D-glycero-alpha-D-manno-heptose-7-phosphate kinase
MAMATVETRDDRQIVICSQDLGCDEAIPSLEDMQFGGPLDLVKRALAYYRPSVGLDILVASQAPKGSGLGGSSALLMALSSCLNRVAERGLARGQIIDVGANIEAQVIGIPTGKQDYFPPMFGGVCAMWFDVDGWEFESLSQEGDLLAELNRRMVVSYTGIPHFSSVTNWAMLKRYIEDEGDTVARMKEIKQIAVEMRDCLLGGDMAAFARMVDAEWQLRRGLAEGVTTPEIDAIMAAAADAGALASKICGAGGGGCMITVSEPGRLQPVRQALTAAGARVMEAQLVSQGIQLR